jgi:acyl transferase domain-containing protein/SAM-dependent methyltransferase
MMLAACCDWYNLLACVAEDMKASGRPSHHVVIFGLNDSVPLLPFNKQRLKVSKFQAHTLISETQPAPAIERMSTVSYEFPDSAIAIVGVSCRLPGANNLEELWEFISKGGDAHQEVPKDRVDPSESFRASQGGSSMGQRRFFGNFVDDIRRFDNLFFGINPKEAASLDPQQRMLLELSIEALESSGYLSSHVREAGDSVGCYIGSSLNEYLENTTSHSPSAYTATGTIRAFLCGRLSHYYGWTAPSEVIDTACSSSLVAINRACRAIQMGECSLAIAGGASAITGVNSYLDLGKAGFLSETGQCKPFDASADGYCRAEGAGLVVLKKLSDATSASDEIFGVIPSIATNQGGLSSSLTVPSSIALKSLYLNILGESGFQSSQISYAEAHGTGTQAGDPIEMESIRSVFGSTSRSVPLSVGSIKGNIGHCESAAGVAGLLKVLAMLRYGGIPPQANHNQLNPKIPPIESECMEISRRLRSWDVPLRAALVNSYGAAGSNCALLCCEMPERRVGVAQSRNPKKQKISYPIILSAASRKSLVSNTRALARYLSKNLSQVDVADIAFTLDQLRKRHRYCLDISALDIPSLNSVEGPNFEFPSQSKPVVLVLSGQYDTKVALDRGIYEAYPAFRSYIDACDSEIVRLGYQTIRTVVFQKTSIASAISLQCSIFAVQYACARCWIDSGLKPDAIIGHSLGELVALAVSGVLSLGDCLRLVASRAHLIDTKWGAEKGSMLAIHAGPNEVKKVASRLKSSSQGAVLEIACYNASKSTIVVGTSAAVDLAEDILSTDAEFVEIKFQRLSTTHAFHSLFTEPILSELEKVSRNLNWKSPNIPLETCTREGMSYTQEWNPSRHAREPVYFLKAVQRVEKRIGTCIWFEAGLDTPIVSMVKRACSSPNAHTFQLVKTNTTESPWDCIGDVVSSLWRCGISLSHWAFLGEGRHDFKQVWLPPYQFERQAHWIENIDRVMEANQKSSNCLSSLETKSEFISTRLVFRKEPSSSTSRVIDFSINTKCERFQKIVSGHAVLRQPLCPAPLHMECTAMAIHILLGDIEAAQSISFDELQFQSPLGLDPAREVNLCLEELVSKKSWKFTVHSTLPGSNSQPLAHCVGTVSLQRNVALTTYGRLVTSSINRLHSCETVERLMAKRAYGLFSKVMNYPPFFQGISSVTLDGNEAVAIVKLPENQPGRDESAVWRRCDTVLIDAFISVVGLLLNSSDAASEAEIIIAVGIERVVLTPACQADLSVEWLVYAKFSSTEGTQHTGDVFVCSPKGQVLAMMVGVQFAKVDMTKMGKSLMAANATVSPPPLQRFDDVQFKRTSVVNVSRSSTKSTGAPTPSEDSLDTGIREIISNYTGLNVADIPQDVVLVDLGLDSLSSIEFVAEVQSNFGVDLKTQELSGMTLNDLIRRLAVNASSEAHIRVHVDDADEAISNVAPSLGSNALYGNGIFVDPKAAVPTNITDHPKATSELETASYNPLEALLETDRHFEDAANQRGYSNYHSRVFSMQNDLTLAYILEGFQKLGVDLLSFSPGSVIPPISNIPKHDKLMARLWEVLQNRGIVNKHASIMIRGRADFRNGQSEKTYESFVTHFPQYLPEAKLMKLAGENLARCLKGEQDPLALMFGSPASLNIMEDYYSNSPMVSTLTDQLVTFVITLLRNRKRNGNEQIRILEVGAGTGGTTARLADSLQAAGITCQYTFTDISSRMVLKARDKLKKYPWITFETFDLEKEVPNRFLNQFDITIGTNCVHATTNTVVSCRRIGETLTESGVALLSEGTEALDWFDICFGQLDGWWLAEDGRQHPIQPASKWMETFQAAGFQSTGFSRGPTREAFTQQLLVACKRKWPVPVVSEAAPIEIQSNVYQLETMVYKEVSGVQIHADIYIPRLARKSPVSIGIVTLTNRFLTTNVTCSAHDPWRRLHDVIAESRAPSTDKISPL